MCFDADYGAARDRYAGVSGIVPLSIGLPDGGLHHRVGGRYYPCPALRYHPQAGLGAPLPGDSGTIHTVSVGSIFAPIRIDSGYGESGIVRGFAGDPEKIHNECCAASKNVTLR